MTLCSIIKIFKLCLQGTGKSTVHKYLVNILVNVHSKFNSDEEDWGKRMAAEWPDAWETRRNNVTKWLKMLGLYDEQTNWLSQVNLYSGMKGLLDTHKFMKLFELFSATSWLHQKGRYPRKFEYWLWIHENQSINSLHSENYKMIVSLDAYKFYPFCSLIEITDNQILRNILHIFFLPLSVFWVTL